ncbi:prospero homeobox protein 1 isoform X1 [Mustela nigripes]|uniref:Prospero homeobox protein 1 isoform X1 n=2 Tax=Mustelidae TaxID=9655 RepID=A0A8U0RPD6_MUSPF|nr:prospero homeobox protein 1 isoform X1 [Enhydra lutris kenyoni]XP_032174065.1 prospero homeobox protein 1 isoform X1 [Mustela erminea]XP_032174066.1 prospero homeobox protein 1 isoform X1 [Mustela erminea]XP_032174067.1 prospero homeobox protein 1 isoform X1 [Mustela erminea]XP_032174068.1 prospero homeobox protein 1 isoform X1 [Mustela erminea]XP_032174070.1 prospero homeobox protein 1 isoform X1 [Mustela erminea]XP_032174071.1 prospero homeobox protein 1 isoform X1 [Mustela erminea]XP_0
MPDHDSTALLSRQTKRRRVDIGVKRTVGTASAFFAKARATFFSAMNPQGSEQDVEYSVVQHADGEKSNVLRKLLKRANSYEDAMMPFPGATIISQLLKNNMNKNGGTEPSFQASGLSSTGSEVHQEDICSNSSRDSPPECLSPFGRPTMSQFDMDRLCDEHLRAKRARVENIIRGMSHSPSVALRGNENEREMAPQSVSPRESYRENKRKQKLPQQQQQSFQQLVSARKEQKREERRQLKQQLEDMQKQLRQLQEKFYQIYDSTDSENDEDGNLSEDSMRSEILDARAQDSVGRSDTEMCELDPGQFIDRARALIREQELAENKPKREGNNKERDHGPNSLQPEGKHLAETLKQELNTAMSQVVDTVVKVFAAKPSRQVPQVFPPLQIPQARFAVNGENHNFHTANQRLQCFGDVIIPNPLDTFGNVQMPSSTDQTEALPLVVRKNSSDQATTGPPAGGHHQPLHQSPLSATAGFTTSTFRHPFPLPLMAYPFQSPLGAPSGSFSGKDRASPESLDLTRETTSLRTKMSSHHLSHHPCSPAHPPSTAEGLSLSLIKSECGDLQDMSEISPYSGSAMQEGLSPNHLKKAKLMFFYTRYPSSNMLKTYFSDVKFNRCITSQLIKWFSNFREFYYIQMEKYARQAINDGVTSTEELSITRDCELYRALNMHYNKANDFEQVPERFLEVAQITLREFFNAIIAGKDVDPSWKKAIYKVICKLDSEVPEIFKSPNCLQELLHE